MGLLVAVGLSKVLAVLIVVHLELAAAHAGIATDAMVYGAALLFLGFAARWTAWFYGLSQVLRPGLYEDIGFWLIRLGWIIMTPSTLIVAVTRYL